MTGNEIVKAIRAHKGKVSIPALFGHDTPYIYAEKQDLIRHFSGMGTNETNCSIHIGEDGDAYLDTI